MSIIASVEIIILATLILAFLQLQPGVFAIFEHYGSGKFTHRKRSMLSTFFMLGVETVSACLFICSLLFVNLFYLYTGHPESNCLTWIFVGILFVLALVGLFFYYRPGKRTGSQLFIPRKCAETLTRYASQIDTRSDAFTLGALSSVLELPFTLPLHLISAFFITALSVQWPPSLFLAFIFAFVPLVPLFLIRYRFHAGYTLADILRSRICHKCVVRFVLCYGYIAIAILIIARALA